jgi:outer membrane protein assembly factor BamB
VKIDGEDHIVYITSSAQSRGSNQKTMGNVVGMDASTGKILWQYSNWDCPAQVPCAVDAGDNRLLIAGELRATMLKVNRKADGTFEVSEIFKTEEFGDETKTPLLHNGHFYAMHRAVSKREGLICMNMEGKIMWKTGRNPNFDFGSMILADGLLLANDGFKTLYLIDPDPSAFKPVSKVELLGEGGSWIEGWASEIGSTQNYAPLALADGKLLIRDQYRMICVKVVE